MKVVVSGCGFLLACAGQLELQYVEGNWVVNLDFLIWSSQF